MDPFAETTWGSRLMDPSLSRKAKPRTAGLTMIIDKGLGLSAFRDLLELAGDYIDYIKLGFGTASITPLPVLREKLRLAKQYGVYLYPGGTFFEVACAQREITGYFQTLSEIGFDWVEISDGSLELSATERSHAIEMARSFSFQVITEIGKKEKGSVTPIDLLAETFRQDRACGASFVIIEGRESGRSIGIFNASGEIDTNYVHDICSRVEPERIWWECPQSGQQVTILQLLGAEANLGNIPVTEVLSVESLRRGLRSDTFFTFGSTTQEGPV
ncbi:phosphosulfolactate synthase [Salinithrix halophila]|uniref:Phosphosulfolactate synthase n=1 Tax=Salinithrix halophila TaxID=1485204 RepID=A0ABV8JM06_9BACL